MTSSSSMVLVSAVLTALLQSAGVAGYSWSIQGQPKQCTDMTVNVNGGTPPYRLLVIPFGASPINVEARKIFQQNFNGNDNTLTFKMNYPANSQFVAVMSDATGFGSGGTTVSTQVQSSSDSSCFDSTKSVSPAFTYAITPDGVIEQCTNTRIWWDASTVQGDTTFLGVIPGGISFVVPQGSLSNVPSEGTGFNWQPSLRGGTTLMLIGGDSRGNGSAGSQTFTVTSKNTADENSCINNNSPSSTAGTPAGAVATQTGGGGGGGGSSGSNTDDSSSSNNTGAIVGGVVGGVIAIIAAILLVWFFFRRRKHARPQKETVDLLHADDGDEGPHQHNQQLPQYYEPEPFIVPDPTVGSSSADGHTSTGYRMSHDALSSSRSGTPDMLSSRGGPTPSSTSGPRKTPMKQLRPVNIIQHDDAGPSEPAEGDTIELPPAYTNLKPRGEGASTPSSQHPPTTTTAEGSSSTAAAGGASSSST